MRVLLIEDDEAVARSVELMLKAAGFNIYTTDMGEDGVDLGKVYEYDLIILDLGLPDISGYEVLKQLRMSRVNTPVLILSGNPDIEAKVKTLGYGADDYLTKPFNKDELIARITAIVRRSKGHAESVIRTGDIIVNLDAKTVEVHGQRVHLTGNHADEGNVPQSSLRRHGRARTQDHRRFHLQAAQEARERQRRPQLYRDGLGSRLCAARTERDRRTNYGVKSPQSRPNRGPGWFH